jgi:hypothetical protein
MVLSKVPGDPIADDPFVAALRSVAAMSRRDAVRRSDLPAINEEVLSAFIAAGIVGRVGGDRYYLVVRSAPRRAPATFTPMSVTLMIAFWAIALLAPLVIWLITR